jgi:predicted transcriptional regulator
MLILKDLAKRLDLVVFCCPEGLEKPVLGAYCGDLLSDVLANADEGSLWITVQTHPNIAGVASLRELCAILLANDRQPQPETLEKAEEQKIPLLGSKLSAFKLAAQIGSLL